MATLGAKGRAYTKQNVCTEKEEGWFPFLEKREMVAPDQKYMSTTSEHLVVRNAVSLVNNRDVFS